MQKPMVVLFKIERETKGAIRYEEIGEDGEPIGQAWAKVGTLYVRKSAFERGVSPPERLKVTIEAVNQ